MLRILIVISTVSLLISCNPSKSKLNHEDVFNDALNRLIDCTHRKICPDTFFIGQQINFNQLDFLKRINKCSELDEIHETMVTNNGMNLIFEYKKMKHENVIPFEYTNSFKPPSLSTSNMSYLYFSPIIELKELNYWVIEISEIKSGANITTEYFLYRKKSDHYIYSKRVCSNNLF